MFVLSYLVGSLAAVAAFVGVARAGYGGRCPRRFHQVAASTFAFVSAMGQAAPGVRLPLPVAAAIVAYSRVHTGVHCPSDVAVGAVIGNLCGGAVRRLATHLAGHAATQR